MRERAFDPHRLDVRALAAAGAELAGEWPQAGFQRLGASTLALADMALPVVVWAVRGELRPVLGGKPQLCLRVKARTSVRLECQRCLMPMPQTIDIDRHFLFVRDEAEAARLDEHSEEEVLVLAERLDLAELVEDELILSLPLVPRHENCPQPLLAPEPADADADPAPHPFAALAALRGGTPSG